MLRKIAWLLTSASLVLIGAMTFSCGSSSISVHPSCSGGPYSIVGNWQMTVTPTGVTAVTGYGAIDSAGLALFFDTSSSTGAGDTLELPTLTGACYFSGNVISYPEPTSTGTTTTVTDSVQGNVNSASSITGIFTGTTSSGTSSSTTSNTLSGTLSAVPFSPLSGAPTALSGARTGEIEGVTDTLSLTFSPTTGSSMSFAGTDTSKCSVSGIFTQVGTSNVFDVSYTVSGASPCVAATLTGIGFESNTDYFDLNNNAAGTYLYADILEASGAVVLEVFQPAD
jgi:hypothetical protein